MDALSFDPSPAYRSLTQSGTKSRPCCRCFSNFDCTSRRSLLTFRRFCTEICYKSGKTGPS